VSDFQFGAEVKLKEEKRKGEKVLQIYAQTFSFCYIKQFSALNLPIRFVSNLPPE
jgi:hypothetical protein